MTATSSTMRMPAEWEKPSAIWLAWPHSLETWPGHFDRIPDFFARWTRMIAEDTPVKILADQDVAKSAEASLGELLRSSKGALSKGALSGNIQLVPIKTNDSWIRDYGPSFVQNSATGKFEAIDWRYNAWGGKYPPWGDDDRAAPQIANHLGIVCHRSELCIEGGAIETDGQGRMLAFRDCIETDTRNPGWSQEAIVNELHRLLGITEIVWLDGGGLQGDDTDGHIDQLARFIDSQNVVVASSDDYSDPNAAGLIANKRQLKLWAQRTDPVVTVHELPIPPARYIDGTRVPESYCNFLRLGPQRMLVPTFGDKFADNRALSILRNLCPDSEVMGLDCRDLIWGLGALHCASLNQWG